MLKDNECSGFPFLYLGGHPLQVINSLGIVFAPPRIRAVLDVVGESFRKVVTEAIYFVLAHPVGGNAVDQLPGIGAVVVKIISPLGGWIGKIAFYVVPRILGGWVRTVKIELYKRALSVGMVQDHIHDHRYASLVTLINQFFKLIGRSIILVCGEVKGGIVSPAAISFKFVNGHQLQYVYFQILEVVEVSGNAGKGVFGVKITDECFVNDAGIRGWRNKVGNLPAVFRLVGLQHRDIPIGLSCRIGNQIGIGGSRDVLVVGGIQNLVGIGVCNFK